MEGATLLVSTNNNNNNKIQSSSFLPLYSFVLIVLLYKMYIIQTRILFLLLYFSLSLSFKLGDVALLPAAARLCRLFDDYTHDCCYYLLLPEQVRCTTCCWTCVDPFSGLPERERARASSVSVLCVIVCKVIDCRWHLRKAAAHEDEWEELPRRIETFLFSFFFSFLFISLSVAQPPPTPLPYLTLPPNILRNSTLLRTSITVVFVGCLLTDSSFFFFKSY